MNEAQLLARAREARLSWFQVVEGKRLQLEALSPGDFARLLGSADQALVDRAVVGWEGFTEADLVDSLSDQPTAFTPALFRAWWDQHPEHWEAISDAVWQASERARERLKVLTEKPTP